MQLLQFLLGTWIARCPSTLKGLLILVDMGLFKVIPCVEVVRVIW